MTNRDFIKDALLGVVTGDAIGVPVEFLSRAELIRTPVTEMLAYGTHHQPAGTWSDDSSLTFCLAEMLCGPYDLQSLANRFVNWKNHGWWTPHGEVFDIGIATAAAIDRLEKGIVPVEAGGKDVDSNGNGSLMRILPLLFFISDKDINDRFRIVKEVSSLTHGHIRSVLSCFIYLELAAQLLAGKGKDAAYQMTCARMRTFLKETAPCSSEEAANFERILCGNIHQLPIAEIYSSGYVIHTLEASIWCLLKGDKFADTVLKAANLGSDADTTAAVTGGLAGLLYGWESIPAEWLDVLARKEDIHELCKKLNVKLRS